MHLLKNECDTENNAFLKKKQIYDKIVAEKSNEINNLYNKIKYDKLTYYYINENNTLISFNGFNRRLGLIRKVKNGSIDLEKATENQEKIESDLNKTTGSINQKSKKLQLIIIK